MHPKCVEAQGTAIQSLGAAGFQLEHIPAPRHDLFPQLELDMVEWSIINFWIDIVGIGLVSE